MLSGRFGRDRTIDYRVGWHHLSYIYTTALLDEPYACALRAHARYKGVQVPGGEPVKLSQYADDKACYLSDNEDAVILDELLRQYELASGSRINRIKSSVLLLGTARPTDFRSLPFQFLGRTDSVKYLGLRVGPNVTDDDLWEDAVDKLGRTLSLWAPRDLTVTGRITVLTTLALSTLWYLAAICPPPNAVASAISKNVWRFLWKGRERGKVARSACLARRTEGGLSMVDFGSICNALRVKFVQRLFDPTPSAWKLFAFADLLAQQCQLRVPMGSRLLLASPPPTALSPFWHGVCSAAALVQLEDCSSPPCYEDVCRQHIVRNRSIVDADGGSLTLSAVPSLAVRHISVHSLLSSNALAQRSAHHVLVRSLLPTAWKATMRAGPAPVSTGEWLFNSSTVVWRVSAVTAEHLRLDCHPVAPDGAISAFASRIPDVRRRDAKLRRAIVSQSGGTMRLHGSAVTSCVDITKLSVLQRVGSKTTRVPLSKSSVSGCSGFLFNLLAVTPDFSAKWADLELPAARRLCGWVWWRHRDRKVADFMWTLLHRRLSVGENRTWSADGDVGCPCGLDLETHQHLFLDCAVARSVWARLGLAWRSTTGYVLNRTLFGFIPPTRTTPARRAYWSLLNLAVPELLYSIWLQRCSTMFEDDEPFHEFVVFALFKQRLRRALLSAAALSKVRGFDDMSRALLSHL